MTEQPAMSPIGQSYASIGHRLGAFLIDLALAAFLWVPAYITYRSRVASVGENGGLLAGSLLFWAGWGALGMLQWSLVARKGYSLGKRVVGIALVDATTLRPIGWGRAIQRHLLLGIFGAFFGILLAVQAFVINASPRRQGWHDAAVHSVVVNGLQRGDAPADALEAASAPITAEAKTAGPTFATGSTAAASATELTTGLVAPPPSTSIAPPPGPPTLTPEHGLVAPPPLSEVPGPVLSPPPGIPPGPLTQPHVGSVVLPPPIDDRTRVGSTRSVAAGWRLVGDTILLLRGTVVVGREPSATEVPDATATKMQDPHRSISKTHAALRATAEALTVEDLDSTNGVYVIRHGVETRLAPRTPTPLAQGELVLFGNVAFSVERDA